MNKNPFHFQFSLYKKTRQPQDKMTELFFDEHIEEVRHRFFQSFFLFFLLLILCFLKVKILVQILELPVPFVKFFQTSPGEYFLSTLKISLYAGLVFGLPNFLSQLVFFLVPGLTTNEKRLSLPLIVSSCLLVFGGLFFSYSILIPAALNFFIGYSSDVIEPLWSFDEYFSFLLLLFLSTSFIFQIPVFQMILSFCRLVTGETMLSLWKFVLLGSVILGGILTPSADPLTQVLLSFAVFSLYLSGSFLAIVFQKQSWGFS